RSVVAGGEPQWGAVDSARWTGCAADAAAGGGGGFRRRAGRPAPARLAAPHRDLLRVHEPPEPQTFGPKTPLISRQPRRRSPFPEIEQTRGISPGSRTGRVAGDG